MIVNALMKIAMAFLGFVLDIIPALPAFPDSLQVVLNQLLVILNNSISLLFVFVRPTTVRTLIPLVIALILFDEIVSLVFFVLKKIPFLSIG